MPLLFFLFALLLIAILYLLIRPIVRGAVYFPTTREAVDSMVGLARPKAGERIADLGSGDGRVLMAFARQGIEAHGYEVNPLLVWKSQWAIRRAGLDGKAFVHWESFWPANLAEFDIISVYGIPYIMKPLSEKLSRELKPGSRVVSNIYTMPGWQASEKERSVSLYVRG